MKRVSGETAAVAALLAAAAALLLYRFHAPGMMADGLDHEVRAVWLLDLLEAGASLSEQPRAWLFARGKHHGTAPAFFYAPLFWLIGPSWTLARLLPALMWLPTLWLWHRLARDLFGRAAGLLVLALCTAHAPLIAGVRTGSAYQTPLLLLAAGSLFLIRRWWRDGGRLPAAGACALMGIGACSHAWFLWLPTALAAAALIFRRAVARRLQATSSAERASTAAACALAAAPAAAFWALRLALLTDPGSSFASAFDSLSPARYFEGLLSALQTLQSTWSGAEVIHWQTGLAPLPPRMPLIVSIWTATAFCAWAAFFGPAARRGALKAALTVFAAMLAQLPVAPPSSPFAITHAYFLYPWPLLFVAVSLASAWAAGPALRAAAAAAALAFLGADAAATVKYMRSLAETGGMAGSSGAIYPLADWLRQAMARGVRPRFLGDDLVGHMRFLIPESRYQDLPHLLPPDGRPSFIHTADDVLERELADAVAALSDDAVIVRARSGIDHLERRFDLVERAARRAGRRLSLEAAFADVDGKTAFEVFVPSRAGPSPHSPRLTLLPAEVASARGDSVESPR